MKRANVACDDLKTFYVACIISVLDYVVPVFPGSLPNYLIKDMERIQKRVMSILPNLEYEMALKKLEMESRCLILLQRTARTNCMAYCLL